MSDQCPHCKRIQALNSHYTLSVSLDDWPRVLLYGGATLVAGDILRLPGLEILLFALLAIVPIICQLQQKKSCESCGVEFTAISKPEEATSKEL